jgi:ABC-type microcin C transport system permease subunit YejE
MSRERVPQRGAQEHTPPPVTAETLQGERRREKRQGEVRAVVRYLLRNRGAVSGYYGGRLDIITQRFIDIMIAVPGIFLAIVVVTVLGVGVTNVMIATGIASVPIYARLVCGSVLAAKQQSYVTAAHAAGIGDFSIIFRHILPNCLAPVIV